MKFFDAYIQDIVSLAHEIFFKNYLDLINVLIVNNVNIPGVDWSLLSKNNAYEKKRGASFFQNTAFFLS